MDYMYLGKKSAEATHAPLTHLHLNSGMYYSGITNWAAAHEIIRKHNSLQIKDWRRMEEGLIFESATHTLEGNPMKSSGPLKEAFDSAIRRGDIQMQVLALSAQTQDAYNLGRISEFEKKLELVKYTLRSIDRESYVLDLASKINYYGLKALGCIRAGNLDKAFDSASIALQHITKTSPTMFFTFAGYSAVNEAFLLLLQWLYATQGIGAGVGHTYLEKIKQWTWAKPKSAQKIIARITTSLSCLQKFCELFTFAESRFHLYQGIFEHMLEKTERAQTAFRLSKETAQKRETIYDKYLLLFVCGNSTSSLYFDEETKAKYVTEAKEGFKKMEVNYEQILLMYQ